MRDRSGPVERVFNFIEDRFALFEIGRVHVEEDRLASLLFDPGGNPIDVGEGSFAIEVNTEDVQPRIGQLQGTGFSKTAGGPRISAHPFRNCPFTLSSIKRELPSHQRSAPRQASSKCQEEEHVALLIRPSRTASSSASGIDAAEVFP